MRCSICLNAIDLNDEATVHNKPEDCIAYLNKQLRYNKNEVQIGATIIKGMLDDIAKYGSPLLLSYMYHKYDAQDFPLRHLKQNLPI